MKVGLIMLAIVGIQHLDNDIVKTAKLRHLILPPHLIIQNNIISESIITPPGSAGSPDR